MAKKLPCTTFPTERARVLAMEGKLLILLGKSLRTSWRPETWLFNGSDHSFLSSLQCTRPLPSMLQTLFDLSSCRVTSDFAVAVLQLVFTHARAVLGANIF